MQAETQECSHVLPLLHPCVQTHVESRMHTWVSLNPSTSLHHRGQHPPLLQAMLQGPLCVSAGSLLASLYCGVSKIVHTIWPIVSRQKTLELRFLFIFNKRRNKALGIKLYWYSTDGLTLTSYPILCKIASCMCHLVQEVSWRLPFQAGFREYPHGFFFGFFPHPPALLTYSGQQKIVYI